MTVYLNSMARIRWQEWLGSTIPAPPTNGQARAGQLICRAADPKTAANDMRALMPRFLADGLAPGKARAGESGRSRRGTGGDNLALTFAGRTMRRSPPGGDRGISSRPS